MKKDGPTEHANGIYATCKVQVTTVLHVISSFCFSLKCFLMYALILDVAADQLCHFC